MKKININDFASLYQLLAKKANEEIKDAFEKLNIDYHDRLLQWIDTSNNDKTYKSLREKYPNIPEYVLFDYYRGSDDILLKRFNNLKWELKTIEVNPESFCLQDQIKFKERDFGKKNPYQIPNDSERMDLQKQILSQKGEGNNEPVILVRRVDGSFSIQEGWHRIMNLLLMGNLNGDESFSEWQPVKIKAWIGSFKK